MNVLKDKTIALRLQGYSYNEINRILGVPKSTLSGWLSDIVLSVDVQKRLDDRARDGGINNFIKMNKEQTVRAQARAKEMREKTALEIPLFSQNDLLLIGAVLYWAEGYKKLKVKNGKEITSHIIGLTNSDPDIIKAFMLFLENNMHIKKEKISIHLRLFPHMDSTEEINYWSGVTGLSILQFNRPSFVISRASKGIRPYNRLPHGIARIQVGDTKEFYRLMGWIDGIKQRLAQFDIKV